MPNSVLVVPRILRTSKNNCDQDLRTGHILSMMDRTCRYARERDDLVPSSKLCCDHRQSASIIVCQKDHTLPQRPGSLAYTGERKGDVIDASAEVCSKPSVIRFVRPPQLQCDALPVSNLLELEPCFGQDVRARSENHRREYRPHGRDR